MFIFNLNKPFDINLQEEKITQIVEKNPIKHQIIKQLVNMFAHNGSKLCRWKGAAQTDDN